MAAKGAVVIQEKNCHLYVPGLYDRPGVGSRRSWANGQKHVCVYCGNAVKRQAADSPRKLTIDHRTPLIRGGADAPSNWAICCWWCNQAKGNMTEAEFRQAIAEVLSEDTP